IKMLILVIPLIGARLSNSYMSLMFIDLFIGVAGTKFVINIKYDSDCYPKEKERLISGIASIGNFGKAIASLVVHLFVDTFNIQWAFRILAIAIIIMAVIFFLGTKDRKQKGNKTLKDSMMALKYKDTWLLSLFYFLTFGAFVAFGNYLPILLQDLFSLTAIDAGQRAAGFVVLATLIRPVGGLIGDKYDPKQLLSIVFAIVAVSAALLAFSKDHIILFTIFCLMIA